MDLAQLVAGLGVFTVLLAALFSDKGSWTRRLLGPPAMALGRAARDLLVADDPPDPLVVAYRAADRRATLLARLRALEDLVTRDEHQSATRQVANRIALEGLRADVAEATRLAVAVATAGWSGPPPVVTRRQAEPDGWDELVITAPRFAAVGGRAGGPSVEVLELGRPARLSRP